MIAKAIFKSKKKQFLDDWERSDRSRKRGKTRQKKNLIKKDENIKKGFR